MFASSMHAKLCNQQENENKSLHLLYLGLQKYSRFLVQNKWDADDIVQETILKAFLTYPPSQISSALLNKMAYHYWIDTLRKRKHEVLEFPEDVSEKDGGTHPDGLLDTVMLLTDKLTPKQAVIFTLKEAFSYQAKEIAEMLDTSEIAIKSSLHRTKKRLEKETTLQSVESYWNEEDKELLGGLLYKSLQAEDPTILIESLSVFPVLLEQPKMFKHNHSSVPLSFYSMAA